MRPNRQLQAEQAKSEGLTAAETLISPECISASMLTIIHNRDHLGINELVQSLKSQSAAINDDDLSRVESMLIAQAHTLDGLFARLTTNAMTSEQLEKFERYMKLALRAQNQSRATMQTLIELKTPKHIAFVKQANIGSQVQVNNESASRTRKNVKTPNELLEVDNEQRMDTRAPRSASTVNQKMAAMDKKYGPE